MRVFGLWVCFMVMLTSIHFISSSSLPDMIFPVYESNIAAALTHSRKLMEKNNNDHNVNMEDYRVDAPPSSKAPIGPGPIIDPPPSSKGNVNMEDYRVDAPPSFKAPIRPGPIIDPPPSSKGNVNMEDYRVDPPPSFKAPIRPGPIIDPPPSSKSPSA